MRTAELAALFRALADLLEQAGPSSISRLAEGELRLVLEPVPKAGKSPAPQLDEMDLETVKGQLAAATTVEEGMQVLARHRIDTRWSLLTTLARHYEVGVRKSERLEDLARRLVAAVVGSRIQSETIRALPL